MGEQDQQEEVDPHRLAQIPKFPNPQAPKSPDGWATCHPLFASLSSPPSQLHLNRCIAVIEMLLIPQDLTLLGYCLLIPAVFEIVRIALGMTSRPPPPPC